MTLRNLTPVVCLVLLAACGGHKSPGGPTANPPQIAKARELVRNAHQRDPVAVDPYFDQSVIETKAGNLPGARTALERAVRLQPANPSTWLALANFQLTELHNPTAAKKTLAAALYLDPRSFDGIQLLIAINRQLSGAPAS